MRQRVVVAAAAGFVFIVFALVYEQLRFFVHKLKMSKILTTLQKNVSNRTYYIGAIRNLKNEIYSVVDIAV